MVTDSSNIMCKVKSPHVPPSSAVAPTGLQRLLTSTWGGELFQTRNDLPFYGHAACWLLPPPHHCFIIFTCGWRRRFSFPPADGDRFTRTETSHVILSNLNNLHMGFCPHKEETRPYQTQTHTVLQQLIIHMNLCVLWVYVLCHTITVCGCGWGGRVLALQLGGRQFEPQSSQKYVKLYCKALWVFIKTRKAQYKSIYSVGTKLNFMLILIFLY